MISFGPSDDQVMVQETVRKFAAEEIRPRAREWERSKGVPDGARRRFDELGLALADVPEELGGLGLGLVTTSIVHEELAFGDAASSVALWGPHLVPAALVELASPEQAKRWLERVKIGAVSWSADAAVNGGIADVVVDLRAGTVGAAGASGTRKEWLGLETVHVAPTSVVDGEKLERFSDDGVRRFFARAQLMTAARQVGLARASYEYALAYDQERMAFGKPVAHFQAIAFKLAEMHMDVEAARWMVWKAATTLDLDDCARAFVQANDAAWRLADDGVQLLGGAGFIQDHLVEKWLRDTKCLAMLGGLDEHARLGELPLPEGAMT